MLGPYKDAPLRPLCRDCTEDTLFVERHRGGTVRLPLSAIDEVVWTPTHLELGVRLVLHPRDGDEEQTWKIRWPDLPRGQTEAWAQTLAARIG